MPGGVENILLAAPGIDEKAVAVALRAAGFTAKLHSVATAVDALEAITEQDFDCAILGQDLPDDGGEALLPDLQGHGIETPVIFLFDEPVQTARAMRVMRAGASDCFAISDLSPERIGRAVVMARRYHTARNKAINAEKRLAMQTLFDPLTNLPNRSLFFDRVDRALSVSRRDGREVAILMLDLNRFRDINNVLSHKAGDQLLREVTERLREAVRTSDTLARLGADEFAVLMPTGASAAGAMGMADRLLNALMAPYTIHEQKIAVGASVGIAIAPKHGMDSSTLLRHAESACHDAKRDNSGYAIFAGDDPTESLRQLSLASDLRNAVANNELVLFYQPKVSFETGQVCGVEALTRWRHPEHGLVPPDRFIPLAEQTGVIEPLTTWLLNEALRQRSAWNEQDLALPVSVNLSPVTLHDERFSDQVAELLTRWDVSPHDLILEITESAIMSDVVRATQTVSRLNDMGVHISIDDFGTGYTSFSYIRKLAVGEIKIDKSFVFNMRTANDDAVIVRTIIEMGKSLGLNVVAEGVEDEETLNVLRSLGCNCCQGYFISEPLDAQTLGTWLSESRWNAEPASNVARLPSSTLRSAG
jgi:diguanylate cyclase (GGDEF)-like protein